jgi:hypothetical protein
VFDLLAGALSSGSFSDADLVRIFDVKVWDAAPDGPRLDAAASATALWAGAVMTYIQTGLDITYLAGFSWGAVTINEYLYGVSAGKFGPGSGIGLALRGVYFVGGPNVHKANVLATCLCLFCGWGVTSRQVV